MGEWEKIRYKNMKENYEFMTELGEELLEMKGGRNSKIIVA